MCWKIVPAFGKSWIPHLDPVSSSGLTIAIGSPIDTSSEIFPPDSSSYSVCSAAAHSVSTVALDVDAVSLGAVVSFAEYTAELSLVDELLEHPVVIARARTTVGVSTLRFYRKGGDSLTENACKTCSHRGAVWLECAGAHQSGNLDIANGLRKVGTWS